MRALFLFGAMVLLLGCSDRTRMPSDKGSAATPEQMQALEAGNARLAAKLTLHWEETKKSADTIDQLRTWAASRWDAEDDKALVDPWGNRIIFRNAAPIGLAFTLRSAGPDGKGGNDDDLTYDSRDKATRTFLERNPK